MNARILILLSVALNVALGAVAWRRAPSPAAPAPMHRVAAVATNAPVVVTVSAPVAEGFDWSRLAAADFKKYRDNLRAVGCPEPTVRDIITAEINAQFLARRRLLLEDIQRRFWDLLARDREVLENSEWKKPLEKLNDERKELLAAVLGDEPDRPDEDQVRRFRRNQERRYAWLPEERRALLVALELDFMARQNALRKEVSHRPDTKWTDADRARQKSLSDELVTARKRIFTAEELAEFQLRNSAAARWASHAPGFEASESEWRTVALRRLEYDEALKKLDKQTPKEVRTQLENEWKAQLKTTLGEERYAAYALAQDGSYQQARRITQRFGLADSVAAQASEMQKTAQEAANRLRGDKSLDPAARQAALAAIAQETQHALETTLGQSAFSAYQKYNGTWLERLNPPQE